MFITACDDLYKLMKKERVSAMTMETYAHKRHRMHDADPQNYDELTHAEELAIASQAKSFPGMSVSYSKDALGRCQRVYICS